MQGGMTVSPDPLHRLVSEDQRQTRFLLNQTSGVFVASALGWLLLVLLNNWSKVVAAHPQSVEERWQLIRGLDVKSPVGDAVAGDNTGLAVALLTVVATLAVAVMAASWRPRDPDYLTELSTVNMVRQLGWSAQVCAMLTCVVAFSSFQNVPIAVFILVVAASAVAIAVAANVRKDVLERALERGHAEQYERALDEQQKKLTAGNPGPSRPAITATSWRACT